MVSQHHNFIRCVRCLDQKKGCEGYPCQRCNNANMPCVPENNARRQLRTIVSPYQQAPPAFSAQPPAPTRQQNNEDDNQSYDQDATEKDDDGLGVELAERAPPGLPRLDSLRTKASGPDMWPNLRWSWVGGGQYCRKEGFERVMAKKRAATEMRKAKQSARSLQSNEESEALSPSSEPRQHHDSARVPATYRMGSALFPSAGASQRADAQLAGTNFGNTTSTFATPPSQSSNATSQDTIIVNRPQEIVAAQQQHEAFYAEVSNMELPAMSDKRQGKMPVGGRKSALMPPPPRPVSTAPSARGITQPTRGHGFVQSFQNVRNTHATESQYTQLSNQPSRQRMDTPPVPRQVANPQSILMQPLHQARWNHATEAEYAALDSTLAFRRADTPPLPGQGSVSNSHSSSPHVPAPAPAPLSLPGPSAWWIAPAEIPADSAGITWPPHHQFEICLGCLRPAHPHGWRCDCPYFRRYGLE